MTGGLPCSLLLVFRNVGTLDAFSLGAFQILAVTRLCGVGDESSGPRNSCSLLLSKYLTPKTLSFFSLAPKQDFFFPTDMLGDLNESVYQMKSVRCIFCCIKNSINIQVLLKFPFPSPVPSPWLPRPEQHPRHFPRVPHTIGGPDWSQWFHGSKLTGRALGWKGLLSGTGEKTWGLSAWRRQGEKGVFPGGFHSDLEAIAIQMFDISLRLPGLNEVPYGARATCAGSGWLLTSPGPGAGGKLEPTVPPRGPRQKQAELASAFCSVRGPISFSLSLQKQERVYLPWMHVERMIWNMKLLA